MIVDRIWEGPDSRERRHQNAMKKQLRFAALVAGVAIIAAACSDGGASTAPSTAPESTAPSTAPESMAPESQAPAGLAGEVTLWHSYSSGAGTELQALNQVLDAVKAANPDLVVNVLEVPFSDIYNKWNTDVATGAGPTMFIAPNDSLGFQAREGVIADLDALLADKLGDIVDVAVSGSQVDGKLYMVPESLKAVAAIYDSAKIATPPATTDELLAGITDGSIKAGFFAIGQAYHNFGWWGAFGGQLMDDSGKCIADTTGVSDAYAYVKSLGDAGAQLYANYDDMANAYKAGEIDYIIDGPWASGGYKEAVPTTAIAPMPAGPAGPAQPLTGVDGWYINPNTPDLQLAVDFALAMTTQESQQVMVDVAGHIPANKNITISDPITQGFADAVATGFPRPQVQQLDNFWGNFSNAWQLVLESGEDPVKAVADACAAMNEANGL
jgi:arabinogalactan oligomer/maltooligosaccharide transport system substrate-binding protein